VRRRTERRDDGAVAVEFALLFPLLFFLLFGTLIMGWRVWEHQAAQSAVRDAARQAAVGIPDLGRFRTTVLCLSEQDGLRRGTLQQLKLDFLADPAAAPGTAQYGGYVRVSLTYRSALGAFPFVTSDDGTFTAVATSRLEQMLAFTGEGCS
jgi:TadE-like protein